MLLSEKNEYHAAWHRAFQLGADTAPITRAFLKKLRFDNLPVIVPGKQVLIRVTGAGGSGGSYVSA